MTSQNDRDKLEKAKELTYQKGFYEGVGNRLVYMGGASWDYKLMKHYEIRCYRKCVALVGGGGGGGRGPLCNMIMDTLKIMN